MNGESFSLAGTYTTNEPDGGREIHTIELYQTLPEASVNEGIWRVSDEVLTYEVVQVTPALPGTQTPPTQSGGFGSTNQGALGSDNIQIYRKVE